MDTSFFHRKLSALIRLRICWICHWRWKILNATYSIFALIINHLQLKVDAGFFHLKYVFIEYHPIEVEGGRYGRSCSIHFNTFLPKRGHQTVKCPMATLLFILWLIIRQLPFEGVPIGPFSVRWARSTTGRQLSERCLYFLTIPVLCPQRKIFDTGFYLRFQAPWRPSRRPDTERARKCPLYQKKHTTIIQHLQANVLIFYWQMQWRWIVRHSEHIKTNHCRKLVWIR